MKKTLVQQIRVYIHVYLYFSLDSNSDNYLRQFRLDLARHIFSSESETNVSIINKVELRKDRLKQYLKEKVTFASVVISQGYEDGTTEEIVFGGDNPHLARYTKQFDNIKNIYQI